MVLPTHADKKIFWQAQESAVNGKTLPAEKVVSMLRFDEAGLLPVVTQCAVSGKVLMLAWMNKDALLQTLATETMVYFSRSRQSLWQKGATSGCKQKLRALAVDCDGDALLATVEQTGGACHTGKSSCFFWALDAKQAVCRE